MIRISEILCEESQLSRSLLNPLVEETLRKALEQGAEAGQTGPAIRRDENTMQQHLLLLEKHPEWLELYKHVSHDIQRVHDHEEKPEQDD